MLLARRSPNRSAARVAWQLLTGRLRQNCYLLDDSSAVVECSPHAIAELLSDASSSTTMHERAIEPSKAPARRDSRASAG